MRMIIRWTPSIICMGFIFFLSHQPGDELNRYMPLFQKWFPNMESFNGGHFVAYFVLCICYYWAIPNQWNLMGKFTAVLLSVLYGLTDEFHQQFIPGRTPDWLDIRNDLIGAVLAMLLISLPPFQRLLTKLHNAINY